MSPTILRIRNYRFYFLSNEEDRMHIHIESPDGEAKFWLEPRVSLSTSYNLNSKKLKKLEKIVKDKQNEIIKEWKKYFGKH